MARKADIKALDQAEAAIEDPELATELVAEAPLEPPFTGKVSPVIPFTIATAFMMEGLNGTIINTSLPQIARSLNVTPVDLSVAVTSYILSLAVFIPVSGWIADRFGARKVFCSAIVIFVLGSMLCGLAPSLDMMIAARILQGFGGAMMTPVGRLILARSFPKEQLIRAMNYMMIPGMIGPMMGPIVGGFLTTYVSWRWIFFINVPISAISIMFTIRLIEDIRMPPPPPLDWRGFALAGTGLAFAQLSLEYVGRRSVSVEAQVMFIVTAAVALFVYARHARNHPAPLLDLSLFRIRTFAVSVLGGSVSRMAIGSVPFLLPLLFQIGFGLDAFHSGMLMVVSTVGAFMMRFGVPKLLRMIGIRAALMSNALMVGIGLMCFVFFRADTPQWMLITYLFVFGFIRSVQMSSLGALSYADLPHEMMARGTSLSAVAQRLSMSSGIAISATLLSLFSGGATRTHMTPHDFMPVFLIMGVIELASIWGYRQLKPTDARALTGHRGHRWAHAAGETRSKDAYSAAD